MTKKRFTINTLDGSIDLRDNGKIMTYKGTVDLLNELHEENRELKRHLNAMRSGALTDDKRIKELYDENEQLKKDVEYWKQVASQYSNELNVFEHCKKYKTECKDIYWSSD